MRRQQVSGQTAIAFLEQLWNRDLSGYDPDGPLPDIDPDPGENTIGPRPGQRADVPGPAGHRGAVAGPGGGGQAVDPRADHRGHRPADVRRVAGHDGRGRSTTWCRRTPATGSSWCRTSRPAGWIEFADTVVPLLQERGVFRSEYEGTTLRDHLGLEPLKAALMTAVPLAVLDLVPISSGSTAAQALRNSIDLAQAAERLGYARYWFAEHHLNPGVAGTSPAVVLALTAAATSAIRIGSGAVQMGHRTALATVEEFGLVDALYPGRLDLGLGRSGGRPPEARATGGRRLARERSGDRWRRTGC